MTFATQTGVIKTLAASVCAAALLSACVVAPLPPRGGYAYDSDGYAPPAGVVYVAPTYAIPGPGYGWRYHARFGWGWMHPRFGWHRGWR